MTTVYVSGPMSGLPDHNYAAFAAAQARLEAEGYRVRSPHRIGQREGWAWEDYMRRAVALLVQCDAIHMLPGWETSHGARLELSIAQQLGFTVTYADGGGS